MLNGILLLLLCITIHRHEVFMTKFKKRGFVKTEAPLNVDFKIMLTKCDYCIVFVIHLNYIR